MDMDLAIVKKTFLLQIHSVVLKKHKEDQRPMENLCQHLYWQCSIAGGLYKVEAHLKRHIYYHNTAFFTKRRWEKGVLLGWRNLDNTAQ